MIGYPPRPTSILPKTLEPVEWIVQPKCRGWRIIIHNNKSYTRKGRPLEINFKSKHEPKFDYQLDGEIIPANGEQTEHRVSKAIKSNKFKVQIFDIYIPSKPSMMLIDRLNVLMDEFGFDIYRFPMWSINHINQILLMMKKGGFEGIVLKRKDNIYKISTICEIIDPEWIIIK